MLRVLRLGSSGDTAVAMPPGQRGHEIAERVLAEASGEPVETIVRLIWPDERLPGLISGWMEEQRPDLVFLRVNAFWFNYESVPLRIERRLRRLARPLARLGVQAGESPLVGSSKAFRRLRKLAISTVGYDTYFTTGQVIERVDQCIRRVLASEHAGLVVRGPFNIHGTGASLPLPARAAREHESRHVAVDSALREICSRLRVTYFSPWTPDPDCSDPDLVAPDGMHFGARGHRRDGAEEGAAMIEEWRRLRAVPGGARERSAAGEDSRRSEMGARR